MSEDQKAPVTGMTRGLPSRAWGPRQPGGVGQERGFEYDLPLRAVGDGLPRLARSLAPHGARLRGFACSRPPRPRHWIRPLPSSSRRPCGAPDRASSFETVSDDVVGPREGTSPSRIVIQFVSSSGSGRPSRFQLPGHKNEPGKRREASRSTHRVDRSRELASSSLHDSLAHGVTVALLVLIQAVLVRI